ncbi:pyridoxamine 5'-phosphate oxidase family protein [Nocardioides pantholopis]|uniref:pyridoxamine 5'-phosphate oxidase family protein n=1 Tax=Nocardioides pantholopis TaxID=2483798 RepID=UPI000FDCC370|nr:pyridoxamine 5'-phosphate oxidase family protein [Nocardioides pantholopis]
MTDPTPEMAKLAELVDAARICMVTTMTADGAHVSRPMALQDVEFDGDLWFFTYDDSAKAEQVRRHPAVNVSFADHRNTSWTSVSGQAEMVHDRAQAERLWSAPLKVWFPDGIDTPGLALLRVQAETAEYWESPSSRVKRLLGAARAAVTGDPDKFPGDNRTVRLDP